MVSPAPALPKSMKITPVFVNGLDLYSYMGDRLATFTSYDALDQVVNHLNHTEEVVSKLEDQMDMVSSTVKELAEETQTLENLFTSLTRHN